jgi:hypothetical protein
MWNNSKQLKIEKKFKTSGCLIIDHPGLFSFGVSKKIPKFQSSIQGLAIYKEKRIIVEDNIKLFDEIEYTKLPNGSYSLNPFLYAMMNNIPNELYFLKSNKYCDESEYRILWSSGLQTKPYIDIKVPEVREFCRYEYY